MSVSNKEEKIQHQPGKSMHQPIETPTAFFLPNEAANVEQNTPHPVSQKYPVSPSSTAQHIPERDEIQVEQDKEMMTVQLDIHAGRV